MTQDDGSNNNNNNIIVLLLDDLLKRGCIYETVQSRVSRLTSGKL